MTHRRADADVLILPDKTVMVVGGTADGNYPVLNPELVDPETETWSAAAPMPVPVDDAVLGGEVEIETLAGKRIAVKVPPLTQNGTQIKLKGLGMPKLGKKKSGNGDLYARVRITIPEELSDEQRELFEKLREARKAPADKAETGKDPAEAKA